MSQNPISQQEESKPASSPASESRAIPVLRVARYTINAGRTDQGNGKFLSNTTVRLEGPPLQAGDIILQVVTDCEEAFGDADGGDNTTLNIRFNDGSTQTDIQAAASIGGAPFSTVSRRLMVQDMATEGDWLKLTLPTWVEVIVGNDQDLDDGLMHVYVLYIGGE